MRGHAYGHLQVVWALLLAVLTCPAGADPAWSRYVLKVEVTHTDGRRETGSAVPLAGNRMVTNCHVLRNAVAIRVANPERQWLATMAHSDAYRDLCFLEVPGYRGPVAPVAEEETRVGKDVLAVGYTGGRLAINPGHVKGLHTCPCDGGRVIQTSAPFDRGASGGGLFNDQGRLVGILTFKSQAGGNFHFALPVGWLRGLALERMHTCAMKLRSGNVPARTAAIFLPPVRWTRRKTGGNYPIWQTPGPCRKPTIRRPGWHSAVPTSA
jgi:S1-C subfamily serine protease